MSKDLAVEENMFKKIEAGGKKKLLKPIYALLVQMIILSLCLDMTTRRNLFENHLGISDGEIILQDDFDPSQLRFIYETVSKIYLRVKLEFRYQKIFLTGRRRERQKL